jgi:hypothetical protein
MRVLMASILCLTMTFSAFAGDGAYKLTYDGWVYKQRHYCPANVLDLASNFFCCMKLGAKLGCRDLNAYRS